MEANQILMGKSGADHIEIGITSSSNVERWLDSTLDIKAGPWSGSFRAWFYAGELRHLADDIDGLYTDLVGPVDFQPMEAYIELHLRGNGRGLITIEGKAMDDPASGAHLVFQLELDQTELPTISAQLRAADPA
jgi:hypothetical protein